MRLPNTEDPAGTQSAGGLCHDFSSNQGTSPNGLCRLDTSMPEHLSHHSDPSPSPDPRSYFLIDIDVLAVVFHGDH